MTFMQNLKKISAGRKEKDKKKQEGETGRKKMEGAGLDKKQEKENERKKKEGAGLEKKIGRREGKKEEGRRRKKKDQRR